MNKGLMKFANKFTLKVEGVEKSAYLDDYEKGQEINGSHFDIDFIDKEFVLSGKESKEELTSLVVDYLRKELYSDKINDNWIMIGDSHISLAMLENNDAEPIDDPKVYWENGENVWASYYLMEISINGHLLERDSMVELFNFDY